MEYYLLHIIRTINDLIIEAISNQYVPIVKITRTTILTSAGNMEKNINAAYGKN